ncbi:MAG TPA: serpin family protein [Candidatus Cloacimonadota bacterium]|nr:serpin family protein [Candidatus Cloacimonadota bacterium]HPT71085.1 serpin family protein [Candidatus Cloacimonadota bacterium]
MKRIFILLMISLIFMSCANTKKVIPSNQASVDVPELVSDNNAFAFDMYSRLSKENPNVLFSPYSISTAFGMVEAGAVGNTEKEISSVMRFTLPQVDLQSSFKSLQGKILNSTTKNEYELNIANALFASGELKSKFQKDYFNQVISSYASELTFLNFRNNVESADLINQWVDKQTNHNIDSIVNPDILDPSTAMVLVNAIYFRGDWERQFKTENTKETDFRLLDTTGNIDYTTVLMMNDTADYNYSDLGDYQMLELPYKGDQISMIYLLPKKINGINELENNINAENLSLWMNKLSKQEVNVSIPKFKMMMSYEKMADILKDMGMQTPFGHADFSRMIKDEPVNISNVIHKAFMIVNEEGTEASASTAVVMRKTLSSPAVIFRADHPFIFMIMHKPTGSILFMGKMQNPKNL